MAQDLVVRKGTTVTLGADPLPGHEDALQRLQLKTYGDLVKTGMVSADALKPLMTAARDVTAAAITNPGTFARRRPAGAVRFDLGRFPGMLAAAPGVQLHELTRFWRVARTDDPVAVSRWSDSRLTAIKLPRMIELLRWLFRDVTIESGSKLTLSGLDSHLTCGALLIRKNGVLHVAGKSATVSCTSLQGEE